MAARFDEIIRADFERVFEEFFEELLIEPWRARLARPDAGEVSEYPDRYEVRLKEPGADPAGVEVEVTTHRLTVRAGGIAKNAAERRWEFAGAIDPERVTARWSQGTLTVVLPRRSARRVPLD